MLKIIGYILIALLVFIMFFTPARNYMNNLFHRQKSELKEGQIIGTVSGYNPRIEEVQRILKEAGFEPGPMDGVMGAQTRAAIRKFQKAKGLRPTGKIDSDTQLALNKEKEIVKTSPEKESKVGLSLDWSTPTIIKEQDLDTDKQDMAKKVKVQDEVLSFRLKSKDRVKKIQTALKKAGFYKGEVDGKIGPQTKRAIKAFQKSKGFNPDGIVGPRTWEELNKYLKD